MKIRDTKHKLNWWNNLSLENQFYKLIAANSVIEGDCATHPNSLSDKEIVKVYDYHHKSL